MSSMIVLLAALAQIDAPPEVKKPPSQCVCDESRKKSDTAFEGVPFDAQLVIGAGGLSVEPRQATVFRVARKIEGEAPAVARVWHVTRDEDCGVVFKYGRPYIVRARTVADGIETNACLVTEKRADPS